MVGKRFGSLTVVGQAGHIVDKSGARHIAWECQCKCGNKVVKPASVMTGANWHSCGCAKRRTALGERVGNLVVASVEGTSENGARLLRCRCNCGKEVVVPEVFCREEVIQSCGCDGHGLNLVGQSFGELTVVDKVRDGVLWECRCSCGEMVSLPTEKLISPKKLLDCGGEIHHLNVFGDRIRQELYSRWANMKQRCYDPTDKHYRNYGGRGIVMCCEWRDNYLAFEKWALSAGYADDEWQWAADKPTIDRIDPDGIYCPENCWWATTAQQNRNRRMDYIIDSRGNRMNVHEWKMLVLVSPAEIKRRLRKGWTPDEALYTQAGAELPSIDEALRNKIWRIKG